MFKNQQNPTPGTFVTHLVQVLALKNQWSKAFTTEYIATAAGFGPDIVYKWRQNRVTPTEETVETLLELGQAEAQLDREWGLQLVRSARYFELLDVVDRLWEPAEAIMIPHNLPKPTYTEFVGRSEERQRLLELLGTTSAAPLIMVDGIGGVGKTALVIHVAYQCLEASCSTSELVDAPTFAVIIFVSAKQKYLTADGILPRAYAPDTLRSIYREIAHVLDLDITHLTLEELPSHIRYALSKQRTLLIVDNLETVEDKDSVLAFLYDLPAQVKVVITTREQRYYTPIQLASLAESEGLLLIEQEAAKQQLQLSKGEARQLYAGTGGIPAAIIYGIGQLAIGRELSNVLMRMADHEGDVARFFFHDSVAPLRGRAAHHLLMAIAMFAKTPQSNLAFYVADLADDPWRANEAEVHLLRLSLIHKEEQRFIMHPLTCEYTLAELGTHVEFERAARTRWIAAYTQFVVESVAAVDEYWGEHYRPLLDEWENIEAVLEWLKQQQRYQEFLQLWQNLNAFTLYYGDVADRLTTLQWLSQAAERHGDRQTQVQALRDQALTLMLLGTEEQLRLAEQCLTEAWVLRHDVTELWQSYLADAFVAYYLQAHQYQDAMGWLEIAERLMDKVIADEQECCSKQLSTLYQKAQYFLVTKQLPKAHQLFTQIQSLSRQHLQCGLYYDAQHALASIALVRNDLATAETLLLDGLRAVEAHHDRRRTACYKQLLADLSQRHSQPVAAKRWADEAEQLFEALGIQADWTELQQSAEPIAVST